MEPRLGWRSILGGSHNRLMARLIRAEISNSNTAEEGVAMLLYIEY